MEKINILPALKIEELRQENIKLAKIITELEIQRNIYKDENKKLKENINNYIDKNKSYLDEKYVVIEYNKFKHKLNKGDFDE